VRQTAHSKVNAELRSPMSMAKAEKLSGISQQKVSRWNGRLVDAPPRCAVALLVRLSRVDAKDGCHRADGLGAAGVRRESPALGQLAGLTKPDHDFRPGPVRRPLMAWLVKGILCEAGYPYAAAVHGVRVASPRCPDEIGLFSAWTLIPPESRGRPLMTNPSWTISGGLRP
jgi:hypothetical protein